MRTNLIGATAALALLAGCGDNALRYSVPAVPVTQERVGIAYNSVEVLAVSLPSYAAAEEIYIRGADGALTSSTDLLWSDDPSRAVTLELTRYLGQITGARVAPEPWPFAERAAARLDVRVEEMYAEPGRFVMTGQFFGAPEDGGRDRAGLFSLAAPIPEGGGAAASAAARAQVMRDLAADIARRALR